jgi:hypothetical protein
MRDRLQAIPPSVLISIAGSHMEKNLCNGSAIYSFSVEESGQVTR